MAEKSRITIIKEFFGLKPGQTLKEFLDEVKCLNDNERMEIVDLICAQTGDTVKV